MFRQDGYSLSFFGRMLAEGPRRNAYVEAMRRSIFPGCSVLEVGTGPGFFAMLACQLGAAQVYAVEPDESIEAARLCAAGNFGSDRIQWLRALSTEIDLPERVDVVLADLRGCLPTYNHNIDSMVDARRRHLKPGGTLVPLRDVLRVAPVQSTLEFTKTLRFWSEPTLGIDMSAARRFVANEMWRTEIDPEQLLAPAADLAVIDYTAAEDSHVRGNADFVVERSGVAHGWLVWFDAELAEGVGFSNGPDQPLLVYGRAFLPIEYPLTVNRGDRLRCGFASKMVAGRDITRWTTTVTPISGASVRYDQSSFKSKPLVAESLTRMSAHYMPTLGCDGQLDLAVLTLMQDSLSVGEIAERIATLFPLRFPQHAAALAYAASMSRKYAEHAQAMRA